MHHAEKMYIVPSQQLERLRNPPDRDENIRTTTIHKLDEEMKNILQSVGMSEHEKAKCYSEVLQRYLVLNRQRDMEKEKINLYLQAQDETSTAASLENIIPPDPVIQEVLNSINMRYRKNAELLLNKLLKNKNVASWEGNGTFVYRGNPVNGSNLLDLVRGATQPQALSQRRIPRGWEEFMQTLAELNMPSTVMGNAANRDVLARLKENPSVKATKMYTGPIKSKELLPHKKRKLSHRYRWLSV